MTPSDQIPEGGERKPSEILSAAADLIEPEGAWTQGAYARLEGGLSGYGFEPGVLCRCAVGGVYGAIGGFPAEDIASFFRHTPHESIGHFQLWNDAPERTQAEVVTALRQAAEKAREAGQ